MFVVTTAELVLESFAKPALERSEGLEDKLREGLKERLKSPLRTRQCQRDKVIGFPVSIDSLAARVTSSVFSPSA